MPEDEDFWDDVGFVKSSSQRTKVVNTLDGPHMPREIAEKTGLHQSNVSRALGELRNRSIVEVINEEARKGRMYRLTRKGEKIVEELR